MCSHQWLLLQSTLQFDDIILVSADLPQLQRSFCVKDLSPLKDDRTSTLEQNQKVFSCSVSVAEHRSTNTFHIRRMHQKKGITMDYWSLFHLQAYSFSFVKREEQRISFSDATLTCTPLFWFSVVYFLPHSSAIYGNDRNRARWHRGTSCSINSVLKTK